MGSGVHEQTPDHQGNGIGQALVDDARSKSDHLEVGVLEANTSGRRFYGAHGFELVERRIDEVTGHPEIRLRLG
jgi:putative acetyltransferase